MKCQYDNVQRLFTLCWLSNEANSIVDTPQDLQNVMSERILKAFESAAFKELAGDWNLAWGPVVMTDPREHKDVLTNGMYVACSADGSQYVIAVTSTNSNSVYDWEVEDGDVHETTSWTPNRQTQLDPRISVGTSIGLENLLKMRTTAHTALSKNGESLSLMHFMRAQMQDIQQRVEWAVTGYSLGGALAPVLALTLAEDRNDWDPQRYATLTCTAFAGATPGNIDFARYYDQHMGSVTTRVWNAIDVVPHAWDYNMLVQVPSLYMPIQRAGILVAAVVDLAKADALASLFNSPSPYAQLQPYTPGMPGQVSLPLATISDHQAFSAILKAVMDKVVELALTALPGLPGFIKAGIENMIDSAYNWIDAHTTAIDDLIDKVLAELDKIGKHHHIDWIGRVVRLLLSEAELFMAFFNQLGYQHTTAYLQLLGVEPMPTVLGQIIDIEGDRLKRQEQQMQALVAKLKSLITVEFLHRHGHPIPA